MPTHPKYLWTKVELYGANNDGNPRRYKIADGISISKGDMLYLTEDREASGAILGLKPLAGVAMEDKTAGDGITSISCWTDGVFLARASFAFSCGEPFTGDTLTNNTIKPAPATYQLASGAIVGGYVLDTATADTDLNVRLRL